MIEHRQYSRIGHLSPFNFLEIAVGSLKRSDELKEKIKNLEAKGKIDNEGPEIFEEETAIMELEHQRLNETIISVVFLSSFLESYFFEFAATALGQSYTERHIEKIDLISKIVLIPRLVTGKDIDRSKSYWADLKGLVKWRNHVVHNKTKDAIAYLKNVKDYDPKYLFEEFELRSFFEAIKGLFKDLEYMDPEGLHWFKLTKLIKE